MKITLVIASIFLVILGSFVFLYKDPPTINPENILVSAIIEYPQEYNYKQTLNDCGPYNVAAVIRVINKEEVDSSTLAEEIKWRLPNKYTLPWGLEKQLKEHGVATEMPNLIFLTDQERLDFLKENLSLQKPIIILGEQEGFEHYITILGFDTENNFHIYNSLYDEDENYDKPGNRDLSSEDLMDFWRKGGMYGLFKWYAIASS